MTTRTLPLVLAISLVASTSSSASVRLSLDVQTSVIPDTSMISPYYTGDADTLFAFLIARGCSSVSGVSVSYELESNGAITNAGFRYLPPFAASVIDYYGFSPQPIGALKGTCIIGYWVLALSADTESIGSLVLKGPCGLNGPQAYILDEQRRVVVTDYLDHAGINDPPPETTVQTGHLAPSWEPQETILVDLGDLARLPEGVAGAPDVMCVLDSSLALALLPGSPTYLQRLFPSSSRADTIALTVDGLRVALPDLSSQYRVAVADSASAPEVCQVLRETAGARSVAIDGPLIPLLLPDDDCFDPWQWHLDHKEEMGGSLSADINAPEAWDLCTGAPSVTVAILDTGVDKSFYETSHVGGDDGFGHPDPEYAHHGTWVASVLGARSNNDYACSGVDWACTLISERLDPYTVSEAAAAIYQAVAHGASVLVMPFVTYPNEGNTYQFRVACLYAALQGVVLVAAVGEDELDDPLRYPADYDVCMAVAGTDKYDQAYYSSDWGSFVDLAAPATNITLSDPEMTTPPYTYCGLHEGNSYSAGIVGGVVSLLSALRPDIEGTDLREFVLRSCRDVEQQGYDPMTGHGAVDAYGALGMARDLSVLHRSVLYPWLAVNSTSPWEVRYWEDPPHGYESGDYLLKTYEMIAQVDFELSYVSQPLVWCRVAG